MRIHLFSMALNVNIVSQVEDCSNLEHDCNDFYHGVEKSTVKLQNSDVLNNLDVKFGHLSENEKQIMTGVLLGYPNVFSDDPGLTDLTCRDVDVGDAKPIILSKEYNIK